ncbi:Uncharacterised protein [Enterobacter cloacae]|nr:Uncharacterised protein [Enterobacter cloacae]
MTGTHVKQQIRWQHMHNGIRNAQSAQEDTKKVKYRRHHDRKLRSHCASVDNRCYCVCSVVEAVDRFVKQHKNQSKQ